MNSLIIGLCCQHIVKIKNKIVNSRMYKNTMNDYVVMKENIQTISYKEDI